MSFKLKNMFKSKTAAKATDEAANEEQAVILTIPLSNSKNFGSKDQQKAIYALEDEIEKLIPLEAEVDGHEFGDGECIIYLYGQSADVIFDAIRATLQKSKFSDIAVVLRYGAAENKNAKEKHITIN